MIHLSGIMHDQVDQVWGKAAGFLQPAIDMFEDEFTSEYVLEQLQARRYQLWIGHEDNDIAFVGVTELNYFDATDKLSCVIILLGGANIEEWRDQCLAEVESWAIDQGANEICIKGRPGWARAMKNDGFRMSYIVLAKPLGEKQ